MDFTHAFRNFRIRYQLLVSYSVMFVLIISLGSLIQYSIVRKTIEATIESELTNTNATLLNLVTTAVTVSIKNYLRAMAEKNLEIVRHLYRQSQAGIMSESHAKSLATDLLLSQTVGTTGYIACVNSQGIMTIHPRKEWVGADITHHRFVQEMIVRRTGYIEYDWQNPGEDRMRPKALYMIYFEPWDWIINVSSYRREFSSLVNVDDFRQSLLSLRFGQSGYSFVIDTQGNVVMHPSLQGINILTQSRFAHEPIEIMLQQKSGKITYWWQNPDEAAPRKKFVIFNHLPEYEWIVASSSYMDEFNSPLETVGNVIIFTLMVSLLVVLPMTFWISGTITNRLHELMGRLERGAQGDFTVRVHRRSNDEIGQLTSYFNFFMDKLEKYSQNLKDQISERRRAESQLRLSEEKYRSVMEAAPDPIVVYDMEGRVDYLNPAFTHVFGWSLNECMGRSMDHFVPADTWEETRRGLDTIESGLPLPSVETRRFTKSGQLLDVSIRGAVYRNRHGQLAGSVIIHRDVSDLKRLEKQVIHIGDQERQRIGQDLHDDLCPHLIGVQGLMTVLKNKLKQSHLKEAAHADKITTLLKDAVAKTRRLARGLCPVYLVDHGLEFSLRELAATTRTLFDVDCRFSCASPVRMSDSIAATHLFHMIQEAVHNAAKHGRPRHIAIRLLQADAKIVIQVDDDGCGFDESIRSTGMGLRIMEFRAKIINAALEIRPLAASGTRVQIVLEAEGQPMPAS